MNFVLYQIGWFACVLSGAGGHGWWGAGTAAGLTLLHLTAVPDRRRELALIGTAAAVGLIADSVLFRSGLLTYASPWPGNLRLAPIWIVALWAQFATTLRFSLRWLLGRLWLAALVGAVFGPLAFRGGEALGAVRLGPDRLAAFLALGAVWGLALPFLTQRAGAASGARE